MAKLDAEAIYMWRDIDKMEQMDRGAVEETARPGGRESVCTVRIHG